MAFAETERAAHSVMSAILSGTGAEFQVPDSSGALLSAMIPAYETYKKGSVDAKSVSKSVAVWKRLITFAGDVPVDDLSANEI